MKHYEVRRMRDKDLCDKQFNNRKDFSYGVFSVVSTGWLYKQCYLDTHIYALGLFLYLEHYIWFRVRTSERESPQHLQAPHVP